MKVFSNFTTVKGPPKKLSSGPPGLCPALAVPIWRPYGPKN